MLAAAEADADRMDDIGERPRWEETAAGSLLGKDVLVGLTFERASGEAIAQVQLHGEITHVDAHHGIRLRRAGTGELFWLPPDLGALEKAQPGEYRLRSTGEVLVDPDLLSIWTITEPDDDVVSDWRRTLRVGFEPAGG
jgi:hypothetical protein